MKIIEAIKHIYPEIESGFVYWETKQDGSPLDNPIDGLIWENSEFEKPSWELIESQLSIVKLQEAKATKIFLLKKSRDEEILKPTPQTITYSGNILNKTFNVKINDIFLFGNIIDMLKVSNGTRDWTDAAGNRLSLDVNDYKSLRNHLLVRDETIYNLYSEKKAAIEACQTLEELELINTNLI